MGRLIFGSKTVNRFWMTPLAGLLMSALAVGPAQAEIKIGVVNAARLLQESPQAKAVQESMRNEFAPKQRELAAEQAALKAKQEKYEKDAPTMSADQRAKADKDLRDSNRQHAQKVTDFQEDANTRQNEELSRLQSAIIAEVQSYALAQKFDLVLTEGVVYANSSLDITAAVLAGLQAHSSAAPAAKPAPPATK
jgi:outer membrane protein